MVQSKDIVTDTELMLLSSQNPELRFERNADGTLITMTPTGGISGNREAKAIAYLLTWVESNNLGEVFSSSSGFKLPNGAICSPDAAFVAQKRLGSEWDRGEDRFLNLAPDFVIEIRSKTDRLETLQEKMREYIANGVRLGWLIDWGTPVTAGTVVIRRCNGDRQHQRAFVYREDGSITQYPADAELTGEAVVSGFKIALSSLL